MEEDQEAGRASTGEDDRVYSQAEGSPHGDHPAPPRSPPPATAKEVVKTPPLTPPEGFVSPRQDRRQCVPVRVSGSGQEEPGAGMGRSRLSVQLRGGLFVSPDADEGHGRRDEALAEHGLPVSEEASLMHFGEMGEITAQHTEVSLAGTGAEGRGVEGEGESESEGGGLSVEASASRLQAAEEPTNAVAEESAGQQQPARSGPAQPAAPILAVSALGSNAMRARALLEPAARFLIRAAKREMRKAATRVRPAR